MKQISFIYREFISATQIYVDNQFILYLCKIIINSILGGLQHNVKGEIYLALKLYFAFTVDFIAPKLYCRAFRMKRINALYSSVGEGFRSSFIKQCNCYQFLFVYVRVLGIQLGIILNERRLLHARSEIQEWENNLSQ